MTPRTCARCGARFDPHLTAGLCPVCLAATAATPPAQPPSSGPGDLPPPAPAELAPHFPALAIERLLGRGGMGAVYLARHRELARPVALKVLLLASGDDPAFAERFRREARALAALAHPGIVQVHDFGVSGGWCHLVLEHVDGADLRALLEAGPLEPARALALALQVSRALEYAHGRGIVHRDVKPENVLVDREGRAKLVDFGLARLVRGGEAEPSLTRTGHAVGTPRYMAPEQLHAPGQVDHRADLYALGVLLYELVSGEVPMGRFDPPSRKARVSARFDAVVLRALEADPDRRQQSACELREDLERLEGGALDAAGALEASRPATVAGWTTGWILGIAVGVWALCYAWREVRLARAVGVRDLGPTVDVVATSAVVAVLALLAAGLCRARLRAAERRAGVARPRSFLERPGALLGLGLAGLLALAFAANGPGDAPLTESAWPTAFYLLLLSGGFALAGAVARRRARKPEPTP